MNLRVVRSQSGHLVLDTSEPLVTRTWTFGTALPDEPGRDVESGREPLRRVDDHLQSSMIHNEVHWPGSWCFASALA